MHVAAQILAYFGANHTVNVETQIDLARKSGIIILVVPFHAKMLLTSGLHMELCRKPELNLEWMND